MLFNSLLAQQIEEERRKDALREAEQARLMRVDRDPQGGRGRQVQIVAVLGNLVGFFTRWVHIKSPRRDLSRVR